jgi:hypothetical protein
MHPVLEMRLTHSRYHQHTPGRVTHQVLVLTILCKEVHTVPHMPPIPPIVELAHNLSFFRFSPSLKDWDDFITICRVHGIHFFRCVCTLFSVYISRYTYLYKHIVLVFKTLWYFFVQHVVFYNLLLSLLFRSPSPNMVGWIRITIFATPYRISAPHFRTNETMISKTLSDACDTTFVLWCTWNIHNTNNHGRIEPNLTCYHGIHYATNVGFVCAWYEISCLVVTALFSFFSLVRRIITDIFEVSMPDWSALRLYSTHPASPYSSLWYLDQAYGLMLLLLRLCSNRYSTSCRNSACDIAVLVEHRTPPFPSGTLRSHTDSDNSPIHIHTYTHIHTNSRHRAQPLLCLPTQALRCP